jgi:hypothetical protein
VSAAANAWRTLFRRALQIIDATAISGERIADWSFGGGTVLMRRFRHRVSKDIDIFVPGPQYLGYFSPRLNDTAESLTSKYLESAGFLKLYFAEGEIDFIASAPLTENPHAVETVEGRKARVESTAEILAKKVWHRGRHFTARDIFDLASVAQRDPESVRSIAKFLRRRRLDIRKRIETADKALRTTFGGLDRLDTSLGYDDCVDLVLLTVDRA